MKADSLLNQVLIRGSIFLNTSLTESFGIAILEAACAGLYVVATRVGGVPEILPEDMISFANPDEDGVFFLAYRTHSCLSTHLDVVRAMTEAIDIVSNGQHDPVHAHDRVKEFYDWMSVAERTERVYGNVRHTRPRSFWVRLQRSVFTTPALYAILLTTSPGRWNWGASRGLYLQSYSLSTASFSHSWSGGYLSIL